MKKYCKTVVIMALILALVSFPAVAAGVTRTLEASFGINLVLDGEEFTAYDVNGKKVEPMIVDGTTYLPVRALAEALDMYVEWEGETQTAYLYSEKPDKWIPVDSEFMKKMNPNQLQQNISGFYFEYSTDKDYLAAAGDYDYANGFVYQSEEKSFDRAEIHMELDGAYQSIKFNAALADSKNDCDAVTVVIQDRVTDEVYKRVTIKAGQDNAIEAEINASEELDIFIDDPVMDDYPDGFAYIKSPESRTLVIGNMMLAE